MAVTNGSNCSLLITSADCGSVLAILKALRKVMIAEVFMPSLW